MDVRSILGSGDCGIATALWLGMKRRQGKDRIFLDPALMHTDEVQSLPVCQPFQAAAPSGTRPICAANTSTSSNESPPHAGHFKPTSG